MNKRNIFSHIIGAALFLGLSSMFAFGQAATTTGTVAMNGTVSNYVDLTAAGAAVLTGNSGGMVTTPGSAGNPIDVVANLGELGPSNLNGFVKLTVPMRVRSNVGYQVSMLATVDSGTATRGINGDDVGFGIGSVVRLGTGVNTGGSDTPSADDPTTAGGAPDPSTGRWVFTDINNRISTYATQTEVLNGDYVLDPVPTTNNNALTADAYFAIKPQFFEGGSATTVNVTFTIVPQP